MDNGNLNYSQDKGKEKKVSRVLLISMVIVFIAIIAIICTILYIQSKAFRVYINGASVNLPGDTIIIDQTTGKIQVDIMGIASYLGYDAHKGEYKLYTEDENKCWVDCENETASFFLNSNKISKMPPKQTMDYEDYIITDPVISKNGKLYCTPEGIRIGFNVIFNYNENANNIQIYTLPHLVEQYDATLKAQGYKEGISKVFNNQKAILYDMFVVKKENNLYGVVNSQNQEIIGSRYSKMEFNENAREYYVTNTTSKKGIVTETGVTKINLLYDDIAMIDKNNGLYLAKNNNRYGVLGNTGNIVVHLEYDQIGVDVSKFPNNMINNKYVLFENAIPVCQNKKWGMFDIRGNLILDLNYDVIGYSSGATGNLSGKIVNNLAVVPTYKAIVFGQDQEVMNGNNKSTVKKYGVFDYTGKELIPVALTNAYFITNSGVNTYYMEYNGTTLNIEEYLERRKAKNYSNETTNNGTNTNTNTNVNTINTNIVNNISTNTQANTQTNTQANALTSNVTSY